LDFVFLSLFHLYLVEFVKQSRLLLAFSMSCTGMIYHLAADEYFALIMHAYFAHAVFPADMILSVRALCLHAPRLNFVAAQCFSELLGAVIRLISFRLCAR
jgi:hypothetical protein